MDFCKEPKRLLELESCASVQHEEDSQNETYRVEAKHQRREPFKSSRDDFEEFVALLERIQYMKTKHMNFGIWEKILTGEDLDVKVIKTKPPHLSSFQWEDFCAGKDTMSAQKDVCSVSTKDNPSSYEENGKQSIQPANYLKTGSSSSNASDKSPAEIFDLNLEPPSNA
jgi:hypothetical protein